MIPSLTSFPSDFYCYGDSVTDSIRFVSTNLEAGSTDDQQRAHDSSRFTCLPPRVYGVPGEG